MGTTITPPTLLHRVAGRLDAHRVPALASALAPLGSRPVLLDLEATTFIDLAGLDLLAETAAACRDALQPFAIRPLSQPARIILELVGNHDLLDAAGLDVPRDRHGSR